MNISAVIATADRAESLWATLQSLARQDLHPDEIIVVDASVDEKTKRTCEQGVPALLSPIRWVRAETRGAAGQRNQGVKIAAHPLIWFFDDDVIFEQECMRRLWSALLDDPKLGGANAMIINQSYKKPGAASRAVFTLLHGQKEKTFAGKVIGPAVNLLPEDDEELPALVRVEWLNTTCTMYRREALPDPPFDPFFEGYSLMEDLALSLTVAKRGWKLANVRIARVIHNSQPGAHKDDVVKRAAMELRNRLYVMEELLRQNEVSDYLRLLLWESFGLVSSVANRDGARYFLPSLMGKIQCLRDRRGARGR
ncbi:MAG: hypothetical protein QOF24_430 [Verrucomicrobiota bacterium]